MRLLTNTNTASMNLQDQVITPQQSQRLVDLGVLPLIISHAKPAIYTHSSALVHVSEDGADWDCVIPRGYEWSDYPCYSGYPFILPAFTKAEIEELLAVATKGLSAYDDARYALNGYIATSPTPTQGMCSYLIFLIEHKSLDERRLLVDRINAHIKSWFTKQPK